MLLALQTLTLPAPEIGALVLSGLAFPVRRTSGERKLERIGDNTRGLVGGAQPGVRLTKLAWTFETIPLAYARAAQLRALAKARGFVATGNLVGGVARSVCLALDDSDVVRTAGGVREVIRFTLREM